MPPKEANVKPEYKKTIKLELEKLRIVRFKALMLI